MSGHLPPTSVKLPEPWRPPQAQTRQDYFDKLSPSDHGIPGRYRSSSVFDSQPGSVASGRGVGGGRTPLWSPNHTPGHQSSGHHFPFPTQRSPRSSNSVNERGIHQPGADVLRNGQQHPHGHRPRAGSPPPTYAPSAAPSFPTSASAPSLSSVGQGARPYSPQGPIPDLTSSSTSGSQQHHKKHHHLQGSTSSEVASASRGWQDYASNPNAPSPGGSASSKAGFSKNIAPPHVDGRPTDYLHPRNRTYATSQGPSPSHSYSHWDSQLGSERSSSWTKHNESTSPPSHHRSEAAPKMSFADPAPGGEADGRHRYNREGKNDHNGISQEARINRGDESSSPATNPATLTNQKKGTSPQAKVTSLAAHKGQDRSRGRSADARHESSTQIGFETRDRSPGRSHPLYGRVDHDEVEDEEDEEEDELEDDADATKEEHDNVLSNPLKLLAQASDAASAKIENGRVESGGRNSIAAAETMGLLAPSSQSSRLATSAAVNLTGLGKPLYGASRLEDMGPPKYWASRTLPPLHPSATASPGPDFGFRSSSRAFPPAFLGNSGRSRSFPATTDLNNEKHSEGSADSATSVGALVSDRVQFFGRSNAITPSTLDHDAWEYREGKARARVRYGNGYSPGGPADMASPGSGSLDAGSVGSAAKGGIVTIGSRSSADNPASDDGIVAILGKRKRSRSRASKAPAIRRKRISASVTGWDTDGDTPVDSRGHASSGIKGNQPSASAQDSGKENGNGSSGEGEAGASRKDYFNLSLFHSKLDDQDGQDPVEVGLVELKEVEKLFDIFFARINPILDLFDPFLHSVAYVRARSAFLTTVISSMAARFSDTPRDAEIASTLDKHWQDNILPLILLGGYKSVEISQAFLILTTYHKPTNRLVDDRSWQFLGFAIRTATEVGVNRKVTPSSVSTMYNEQVCRRVRNRERLWFNLFLYDRTLSAQTGRPWTISEDRMIAQSSMWHRQDFALPEDVSLVSLIKLRRITAQHAETFDMYISSPDRLDGPQNTLALGVGEQSRVERRLAGLEFFRKNANADLERWKETWCMNSEEKIKEVDTSTPAGKYLVRWAPTAKLFYYHSRLLINSLVLQATEEHQDSILHSPVSVDCWTSAIALIDTVLHDFKEEGIVTCSNDRVVMAVYAAVSALRLTKLDRQYPFVKKDTIIELVRPYGRYLRYILHAWEPSAASTSPGETPSDPITAENQDEKSAERVEQAKELPAVSIPSEKETSEKDGSEGVDRAPQAITSDPAASSKDEEKPLESRKDEHASPVLKDKTKVQSRPTSAAGQNEAGLVFSAGSGTELVATVCDKTPAKESTGLSRADYGMDVDPQPIVSKPNSSPPLRDEQVSDAVAQLVAGVEMGQDLGSSGMVNSGGANWQPSASNLPLAMKDGTEGLGATTVAPFPNPALLNNAGVPTAPVTMMPTGPLDDGQAVAAAAAAAAAVAGVVNNPAGQTSRGGAAVAVAPANEVDTAALASDEAIERMWNYMTSFEPSGLSSAFWQPQTTWNLGGQ
ncbi:hypothetical protein IE53DRAFT_412032 [Violaceomyces palustris]|uniref:Uncharacterized protein n=1 Tax=Violaceomyces palustris TaxID=1673888 RepID=A0ACD0NSS0_9BASI|nr:hypothetical protein IE53DRAFT_412032 [Violaceomyces palustris]